MSAPTAEAQWYFNYLQRWVKKGWYLENKNFTIEDACRLATNKNELYKKQPK